MSNIIISRQNAEILMNEFNIKLAPDGNPKKESIELDKYDSYAHPNAHGRAFTNYSLLVQVEKNLNMGEEYSEHYCRLSFDTLKKRVRLHHLTKDEEAHAFTNEDCYYFIYKLEVLALQAEDTTTGFRNYGAAAGCGVGGTPSSYPYLRNSEKADIEAAWKAEPNYDVFISHAWSNTNFRKLDICKTVVGIVFNRKRGLQWPKK